MDKRFGRGRTVYPGMQARVLDQGNIRTDRHPMITCFIRYDIEPSGLPAFEQYARTWGQAIPRCGADLIGYFGPHEGSATTAYGIYNVASLAEYEAYKTRLREDPQSQENFALARKERFIRREDRIFLKLISAPHAPLVRP